MGGGKKVRARTERRRDEREARRDVRDRERLVRLAPGGAADRPLQVSSVSVVEGRARAESCAQCGGELDLRRHDVVAGDAELRVVELVCRLCHASRRIYLRVDQILPS